MSGKRNVKDRKSADNPARFIDQGLLRSDATEADIIRLCKGAMKYRFHTVCVNPYYVPLCKAILGGSGVKAAGGIKTLARVQKFLKAGATRIGTSSGVEIMEEFKKIVR
jgi:deoxyribose-phosphate aldolase